MKERVVVWAGEWRDVQHHAPAPPTDTPTSWDGTTDCGLTATLTWVHPEHVDSGILCEGCIAATGTAPQLAGEDLGPV